MNTIKLAVLLALLGHTTSVNGLNCANESTRSADAKKKAADAEKVRADAALIVAEEEYN